MSARAWTLFAAVSVVWGTPYLFIKIAVDEMSPGFVAWARLAIAAAVLLPLAIEAAPARPAGGRGDRVTPRSRWRPVDTDLLGEQHVSSSLTAILIATMPLMVALLALRFDAASVPPVLASPGC